MGHVTRQADYSGFVIGTAVANPTDARLLDDVLHDLAHESLALSDGSLLATVDAVILDAVAARDHLGSDVLAHKQAQDTYFPAIVLITHDDSPERWLVRGFDYGLRLPPTEASLRAVLDVVLSHRRRSVELVERATSRYRAIFEATGSATLLVEEDGTILLANHESVNVTGFSRDELIGTKWMQYVAPESLRMMLAYHEERRGQESTAPSRYETRLINKSGEVRDALLFVGMIPETRQSVVSILDITERQQALAAIRKSEALFKNLFKNHDAIMLLIDPATGSIEDANLAAAKFYGWSREKLRRMNIADINTATAEQLKEETEKALSRRTSHFEFTHRLADGTTREVEVLSSPIETGERVLLCAIIHDVSDRVRAEAEALHLERQLAQSQKMEAIGRLAGGIAHDFNNILTTVVGLSDLVLADKTLSQTTRGDVQQIHEAAQRAAALTQKILAFSRRQTLRDEVVSPNEIISGLEDLLRRTLGEDVEIDMRLDPEAGCVKVDRHQFEQCILNLVVNARDAMPNGGKLTLQTGNLNPESDPSSTPSAPTTALGPLEGPCVAVSVSDTGTGMDAETMSHIFEPFFTTKPAGLGTGLGLSTVQGFVGQSGGTVSVESLPGEGATFTIYLPRCETPATPRTRDGRGSEAPARGERILVVEDEAPVRRLVTRVLANLGCEAVPAATAEEALALLDGVHQGFDLVLTDVVLPGEVQGPQLSHALRAMMPGLPVLFMSGYAHDAVVRSGHAIDRTNFLRKPFTASELAEAVHRCLERSRLQHDR
jgi:PAS domain S-box-containing protein